MNIKVDCYAGYRGEQEPRSFWLGERQLRVLEIVDRWMSPTERCFRCRADDGSLYVLSHDEQSGEWDLRAFTHADRIG